MHHPNYDPHLQLMGDSGSNFSVFSIPNSQNQKPDHQFYQLQETKPPDQIFRPPGNNFSYQLLQQQEAERFHQQQEQLTQQHPFSTVNFMGLKEIGVAGEDGGRRNSNLLPGGWNSQENPAIKEPFWRTQRNEDKQCSTEDAAGGEMEGSRTDRCKDSGTKYRIFGELEAIWNLAKFSEGNQAAAASGSALTGENEGNQNPPQKTGFSRMLTDVESPNGGTNVGVVNAAPPRGSETSIGEEITILRKKQKKKRRKRKIEDELSSMADFFQNLVKTVIDHQEFLHTKFLESIEKMEKERTQKEETWRSQETEKHNKEALARAHEEAIASKRVAQIVSQLERITGETINFPAKTSIEPRNDQSGSIKLHTDTNNSRWPRAEVEALIEIRRSLESKFEEPVNSKGRIWDEASAAMASKGYIRSAKKCKEKWENMNKYFKKSKESGVKRSLQSKTCSYFDQLDQINSRKTTFSPSLNSADDSEFLAAFMSENPSLQVRESDVRRIEEKESQDEGNGE